MLLLCLSFPRARACSPLLALGFAQICARPSGELAIRAAEAVLPSRGLPLGLISAAPTSPRFQQLEMNLWLKTLPLFHAESVGGVGVLALA